MTLFAASLHLLGLSQSEAADFLDVRPDTLKSWCSGRRNPPEGIWAPLRALYERQQIAVDHALELIEEKRPDEIAPAMKGPRSTSWPSEGAHMAVAAAVALSVDLPVIDE
ncbi:MAG: helix-turn-helix domain-containing protein [Amphiplicatus sp.]